jgi:hypothetical protein
MTCSSIHLLLKPNENPIEKAILIKGKEGHNMASNGADMQAVRNRWLKKRKSQMAKWLNGFKPKPPKINKTKETK